MDKLDFIEAANELFLLLSTGAIGALVRFLWWLAKRLDAQKKEAQALRQEAKEQETKFRYAMLKNISLQIALIYEQHLAGYTPSSLINQKVLDLHREYSGLGGNGVVDYWVAQIVGNDERSTK